ncbi:Ig-like domain-containing protein, partial [Siminovitchia fortis]
MKRLRKLLIGVMVLLLMMPSMAGAQEKIEKEIRAGEISINLKEDSAPKRQVEGEKDQYLNPDDYPLINEGGFVDSLIDNKYASHRITFENVSSETSDRMIFNIEYMSSSATYKDRYMDLNFYEELNGSLYYVGSSDFDTYGYSSARLGTRMSKSLYDGQPYIYVRLGVYGSLSDQYYSDYTLFKVKNPFYASNEDPPKPPAEGKYALISNESVVGSNYQYTGSFTINNDQYSLDKRLDPEAYQLDVDIPFDYEKYADKKVQEKAAKRSLNVVGDSKAFWVVNFTTDRDYQIQAKLLYTGTKANVWVHNNQITSEAARKLGQEFDQKIHPVVTENFAKESDVDRDGKINILCFDIQDGFYGYGGYIAGYFYSRDLYDVPGSNKSEIFYIDTYPLMGMGSTKDVSAAYDTLAHEFQHMVNFNQNVFVEKGPSMDTWLNEGLSMAAEQIYSGQVLTNRIDYYNRSSSITAGHSLLYWDNNGDTLSNYSLSYLFGQYVKAQVGQGNRVFKEILADKNNDYKAVENVAKNYIDPSITFGKLMTNFRGALFLKEKTGVFGFKGDPGFNGLERKLYSGSSTFLRGGGAIVRESAGNNTIPAYKGDDITYTFFDEQVDQTPPAKPVVQPVSDQDTSVKGTAEAGSTVFVKSGSRELGHSTAAADQTFSVTIPGQKSGTKLTIYAVDKAGNESDYVTITVIDKTPPDMPVVSQ